MSHFEDLTPYTYGDGRDHVWVGGEYASYSPTYQRLNVGWLDAAHPFPQGDPPAGLIPALRWLGGQRINVMRGWHHCPFCQSETARGHGELRVPGRPGFLYAAPELLTHYVAEHRYLPPPEFTDAAIAYAATNDSLEEPSWLPARY